MARKWWPINIIVRSERERERERRCKHPPSRNILVVVGPLEQTQLKLLLYYIIILLYYYMRIIQIPGLN